MPKTDIGKELKSVNNAIVRYLQNNIKPAGFDRITANNGWIIGYLAENKGRDVFSRDLEKEFSVTRSTVSKVVDIMESKGLVQRASVEHDARLKKLVLTEKAEQLFDEMLTSRESFERVLLRGFSKAEAERLVAYLHRMRENVEKATVEKGGKCE